MRNCQTEMVQAHLEKGYIKITNYAHWSELAQRMMK